jgi:hypothetical protein
VPVYLADTFRSQSFSPSQRFVPAWAPWLYFAPHPPIGFLVFRAFPAQPAVKASASRYSLAVGSQKETANRSVCSVPSETSLMTIRTNQLRSERRSYVTKGYSISGVGVDFLRVLEPPEGRSTAHNYQPAPWWLKLPWGVCQYLFRLENTEVFSSCCDCSPLFGRSRRRQTLPTLARRDRSHLELQRLLAAVGPKPA